MKYKCTVLIARVLLAEYLLSIYWGWKSALKSQLLYYIFVNNITIET